MSTVTSPDAGYFTSDVEDGVYYPSSDGKPMAETDIHVDALVLLRQALQDFENRSEVLITTNLFWYWEQGNPKARRAPDVMIVPGVPAQPPRRSFRSWQEGGAVPAAIFEITSWKTWRADMTVKYELYHDLGVREYFVFDPDARYVQPPLQGFRLRGGRYGKIRPGRDGDLSSQLGFRVRVEGKVLRLLVGRTGEPIPTRAELAARERERAEQLQQEVAELRRQLAQPGGPPAP
jgi:Uma2 family endonuclease